MLKKLILENWKSFRYAELPIDPLTVLIGTNASGKSNAIEALTFLNRISTGEKIEAALTDSIENFRGGNDWIGFNQNEEFSLKALIQGTDEKTEYLYSITVKTKPTIQLFNEQLTLIKEAALPGHLFEEIQLFSGSPEFSESGKFLGIYVYLCDEDIPSLDFRSSQSLLSYLPGFRVHDFFVGGLSKDRQDQANEGIRVALNALQNIFTLQPTPSKMRIYSRLSNELSNDASNIAGVLAALPEEDKSYVESTILHYVAHLPERDIQKVWAESVGRLSLDAMLYCEEDWVAGEAPMVVDARAMSDGTLHFLAVVTALLTRPEGGQLVIEEVDNGLHPSRAELLLRMLKELGAKRKIDILVTTHNPALLNALEPGMIPFVVVAHRDVHTGESKLTPLDDIQRLPKLLASGHIGDLATQGAIEKSLSQ